MYERNDRTGARASAPSFHPADQEPGNPPPSHADSSHIARRRFPSGPSYEVDLDEVELFDDAPPSSPVPLTPLPASPPSATPAARASQARQPPFRVPLTARTPRRRMYVLAAVVGALFSIAIGAAAARLFPRVPRHATGAPAVPKPGLPLAPAPSAVAPEVTPAAAGAPHSAPSLVSVPSATEVPVVAVETLPRPHVGVVTGSPGHRMWIDGNLVAGWQVSVACGSHIVQVGSAGVPRTVEVPCGAAINVSP